MTLSNHNYIYIYPPILPLSLSIHIPTPNPLSLSLYRPKTEATTNNTSGDPTASAMELANVDLRSYMCPRHHQDVCIYV